MRLTHVFFAVLTTIPIRNDVSFPLGIVSRNTSTGIRVNNKSICQSPTSSQCLTVSFIIQSCTNNRDNKLRSEREGPMGLRMCANRARNVRRGVERARNVHEMCTTMVMVKCLYS